MSNQKVAVKNHTFQCKAGNQTHVITINYFVAGSHVNYNKRIIYASGKSYTKRNLSDTINRFAGKYPKDRRVGLNVKL